MLMRNSIIEFKHELIERDGIVLWENVFKSYAQRDEKEMILYLDGFIIYAQTELGYLQPCCVTFEHNYYYGIQDIRQYVKSCYIKVGKNVTHTNFKMFPRNIFDFLDIIQKSVCVHKQFQETPNYKAFNFLNKTEEFSNGEDEKKRFLIIMRKMKAAKLGQFVSTVKVISKPVFYEI